MKLQCSWLAFQCAGCETVQCVKQADGAFSQPSKCLNKECNFRTFHPLRSSTYTQTFDWQNVRLQEMVPDDQREGGRVPRTIECELTEDLVNSCTPGDVITVTGIVKVVVCICYFFYFCVDYFTILEFFRFVVSKRMPGKIKVLVCLLSTWKRSVL